MSGKPLLGIVAAATIGLACGNEAPTVTLDSGVDGDRPINELSASEAQDLCEATRRAAASFATEAQDGFCALSGAIAGAFGSIGGGDPARLCQEARDQCREQMPEPPDTEDCDVTQVEASCDVTVAEFERCYNDTLAAVQGWLDDAANASCADLLDENASPLNLELEPPTSCAVIEERCPDLEAGFLDIDLG